MCRSSPRSQPIRTHSSGSTGSTSWPCSGSSLGGSTTPYLAADLTADVFVAVTKNANGTVTVEIDSLTDAAGGSTTFTITAPPAGVTLVISTQTGPGDAQALGIGWARGDVSACQVIDAPAGSGPLGGPPIGG